MKMNYKLLGVLLVASMMLLPLVSATLVDDAKNLISPVFKALFGTAAGASSGTLTTQVLMFTLVTLVVFGVLSAINIFGEGKDWLNVLIGAIISIIGIRFLPAGFLESAAMPSSAFVIILVMGIPFLILFWIIERQVKNSSVRKILWVFYAILIAVLWYYNYNNNPTLKGSSAMWLYPGLILACAIVIWGDKLVQKWVGSNVTKKILNMSAKQQYDMLAVELKDIDKRLGMRDVMTTKEVKDLEAERDKVEKKMQMFEKMI
jgi:hypothetical protein